jgi:YesN/AraC family two-component response regulator
VITVFIVDDQDLVRLGLRTLIDSDDDMTCVGEAADGLAAVAAVTRTRPDIVLMDIRMPGIDGIAATQRITADPELAATRHRANHVRT